MLKKVEPVVDPVFLQNVLLIIINQTETVTFRSVDVWPGGCAKSAYPTYRHVQRPIYSPSQRELAGAIRTMMTPVWVDGACYGLITNEDRLGALELLREAGVDPDKVVADWRARNF